jgi:hypothetical protein
MATFVGHIVEVDYSEEYLSGDIVLRTPVTSTGFLQEEADTTFAGNSAERTPKATARGVLVAPQDSDVFPLGTTVEKTSSFRNGAVYGDND